MACAREVSVCVSSRSSQVMCACRLLRTGGRCRTGSFPPRLGLHIWQGAPLRPDHFGEVRQDLGIQRIRFRQLPSGLRKVPHLQGIHHDDRHPGRRQRPRERDLQPAGGFQHTSAGETTLKRSMI